MAKQVSLMILLAVKQSQRWRKRVRTETERNREGWKESGKKGR